MTYLHVEGSQRVARRKAIYCRSTQMNRASIAADLRAGWWGLFKECSYETPIQVNQDDYRKTSIPPRRTLEPGPDFESELAVRAQR